MENTLDNALCYEVIGVYRDEEDKTAYAKVKEVLAALDPVKLYIGWDYEVYPRFKIKETWVK